jgi:catechol 2,3-dioxygenase-like lactoylglutathione lyase family enzyme
MKLTAPDYIILIVEELDRALRFYTEVLGLRLGHRSGDYAQLDTGATRLALYSRSAMAKTLGIALGTPAPNAPGFEIGFKVVDVDAAFSELVARGALPVVPPTDRFWGQRTAYVRDPDGHLVELAQDLGRSQ